ncbi:hypothetical protein FB45DRAFT_898349 [Roridomyces roridus]|uniref:Uncharacterized protein n=1 Tax=Roridomyces roridus TaxID=1738132 RepID=A0AAD7CCJ6_9AGAR|nr:hypothetical protein FB45DRAFT_898349 [Roridomyces roridus]
MSPDLSKFHGRPIYYSSFLYDEILEANSQQEFSLKDLPVELVARILELSISRALALTSAWIAELVFPIRLAHVLLRTRKQVRSFHALVCSSDRAAGAVKTLWVCDCVWTPGEPASLPTLIADVLRACSHLDSLGCALAPLQRLCTSDEPFPSHLLSVHVTLTEQMSLRTPPGPVGWISKWDRLQQTMHGAGFLGTITHLYLSGHHYQFGDTFPAEYLPHLTHLAVGSERDWSRQPWMYSTYIRDFARAVDSRVRRACGSFQAAVLVFRPPDRWYYDAPLQWEPRELVRAARNCGPDGILVYCIAGGRKFRQSRFWDEAAADGEDIWSLARGQMAFLV